MSTRIWLNKWKAVHASHSNGRRVSFQKKTVELKQGTQARDLHIYTRDILHMLAGTSGDGNANEM